MVKRTLTDSKRAQLQELFSALDSDGGGEVEFEEFALAWKMMAGDREESATIARRAFKEIDVDGNGTMDFEEFARLMLDLEDGRGAVTSAANDPTCGAMLARSARSLRTRKVVDEFIETFSKNDDKYNAWFNEEEEDDDGEEENTGVSDKGVEMNTRRLLSPTRRENKVSSFPPVPARTSLRQRTDDETAASPPVSSNAKCLSPICALRKTCSEKSETTENTSAGKRNTGWKFSNRWKSKDARRSK